MVDILRTEFSILERLLARSFAAVDDRADDLLELRAYALDHLQGVLAGV
jgi:hypothetical protein